MKRKILKILELVLYNPEKYTEEDIRRKLSEKDYKVFSQFCLGGTEPMAGYIVNSGLKLTQKGTREFYRIKEIKQQETFNLLMLITTILLTIATIVGFFV